MGIMWSRAMRRSVAVGLSAVMLGAGISAASAVDTIKWMHLENNPANVKVWQDIATAYEASHPNVKVQLQFLENEAFKAKLPTLLQSNDAPSMFYTWGGGVLKAQSETGAIREVTPALDADNGAWRKTIAPAAIDAMSFDGKVWAIPYQSGVVSFFYNKDLFTKAGVDAGGIKTWADFTAAVQKIKAAGIVPIAVGGGDKWPVHFYWSYLSMRIAGKDGFAAAKANKDGGFSNASFVQAGQDLADLGKLDPFQPGYLGATWNDTLAAFGDGRAAMILSFDNTANVQASNSTNGKGLPESDVGRFPFPTVAGGKGAVTDDFGGVNGWVVTKNAPPETEDFIKFLTSAENLRTQAKQIGFLPTVPAAQDAVTDPLEAAAAQQMAGETWHQNFLDQDLGPDVGRVVNDMSAAIVAGQISPSDAAGQIEDAFSSQ
jgi:raffinose/stachyose/melibiose transport system substrate-binding protein